MRFLWFFSFSYRSVFGCIQMVCARRAETTMAIDARAAQRNAARIRILCCELFCEHRAAAAAKNARCCERRSRDFVSFWPAII